MGEGAKKPEARCHPDRQGVDAPGRWEESHASYPGRSVRLPERLVASRGAAMDEQKSAKAVVAAAHSGEGPNTRSRLDTLSPGGFQGRCGPPRALWVAGRHLGLLDAIRLVVVARTPH